MIGTKEGYWYSYCPETDHLEVFHKDQKVGEIKCLEHELHDEFCQIVDKHKMSIVVMETEEPRFDPCDKPMWTIIRDCLEDEEDGAGYLMDHLKQFEEQIKVYTEGYEQ